MPTTTTLLTVEETASLLGVKPGTLYNWKSMRVGPPSIKVGHLLRYRLEDLEAWLQQQTTSTDETE